MKVYGNWWLVFIGHSLDIYWIPPTHYLPFLLPGETPHLGEARRGATEDARRCHVRTGQWEFPQLVGRWVLGNHVIFNMFSMCLSFFYCCLGLVSKIIQWYQMHGSDYIPNILQCWTRSVIRVMRWSMYPYQLGWVVRPGDLWRMEMWLLTSRIVQRVVSVNFGYDAVWNITIFEANG
jgi:hypothetical protein